MHTCTYQWQIYRETNRGGTGPPMTGGPTAAAAAAWGWGLALGHLLHFACGPPSCPAGCGLLQPFHREIPATTSSPAAGVSC